MIRTFPAALVAFVGLSALGAAADNNLRIGVTAMPPGRGNPYGVVGTTSNVVLPAIYDRLVMLDNDGNLQPQLAERWEMRDPLTWVFHLRHGVTFSNGERFDAPGAKAVLDKVRSEDGATLTSVTAREVRLLAGIEVEDPYTLVIKTAQPNAALARHFFVVPFTAPNHLNKVGFNGLATEPVGTGPFIADTWTADRITMRANKTSWRAPKLDQLEFVPLPEPTARIQALLSGGIEVAVNVDPEQSQTLQAGGQRMAQRKAARILAIALSSLDPASPFKDERVRQAVNYGVNREAITKTLLGGLVEPASQGTIPEALGYNPDLKPYPYDPEKARALLKEAGYPNGFAFDYEFPTGNLPGGEAIMQQIAADLSKIGVKMNVQPISYAQFAKYYVQGGWKSQALLADYPVVAGDGLRSIYRSYHACDANAPWFCDRTIQAVVDAAGIEPDLNKRTEMTRQILKYYRDTAETLLLFPVLGLDGISPRVTHWELWNDIIQFHKLTVKPN
ncbi:MAG: hypothetical protein EXR11_12710 [Rhodospirillaceae bacterium]|nr:hypothetical protein [Rhodospirillaceae bacterium]